MCDRPGPGFRRMHASRGRVLPYLMEPWMRGRPAQMMLDISATWVSLSPRRCPDHINTHHEGQLPSVHLFQGIHGLTHPESALETPSLDRIKQV